MREREASIEEMRIYGEMIFSLENIYNLIDAMITTYIEEDRFFHPYGPKDYMPESESKRIIQEVSTKILTEMSPILRTHLEAVLSKDYVTDIITRRTIMQVTALVQAINENVKQDNLNPRSGTKSILSQFF